jgi:phospholipid/cholesterol/gamma-HCH transport system substrate-binding protein
MTRNVLETLLGAVVLLVAVVFLAFAYRSSQIGETDGYQLTARFDRVDGLNKGSDVRISGIKVGTVTGQDLDPATYRAAVRFSVQNGIELPSDSSAAIVSDGLLGGKYLSLEPGGDIEMLKGGDEISLTQSSVRLEDLIGQMIFSGGQGGQADQPAPPQQPEGSQAGQ